MDLKNTVFALTTCLAVSTPALAETKTYSCAILGNNGGVLSVHVDGQTNKLKKMITQVPAGWDEVKDAPKFKVLDALDKASVRARNVRGALTKDGNIDIISLTDDFLGSNGLFARMEYDNVKKIGTFWTRFNKNDVAQDRFHLSCIAGEVK